MIFSDILYEFIQKNKLAISCYIISAGVSYCFIAIGIPFAYQKAAQYDILTQLPLILKWILGVLILFSIFFTIKKYIVYYIEPKLDSYLRQRIYSLYLLKNEINYKENHISRDITEIINAASNIKSIFMWLLEVVFPIIILCIGVIIYLLCTNTNLGVILLSFISVAILFLFNKIPSLITIERQNQENFYGIINTMDDKLSNLMNIYLNQKMEDSVEIYNNISINVAKEKTKNSIKIQNISWTFLTLIYIGIFFGIIYLYIRLKRGLINKDVFISNLVIMVFLCSKIIDVFDTIHTTNKEFYSVLQLDSFLKNEVSNESKLPIESIQGDILIKNLSYSYDKVTPILSNVCLHLRKGDRVAILGETGTGKTTLIKLILGFYPCEKETIFIDGNDLRSLNIRDVRSHMYYINQSTHLFKDTILTNMRYGNTATDEDILSLCSTYELHSVFDKVGGLSSLVDLHGSNISLGMQKIIVLVRGILRSCSVLFIDEPFTSIDSDTRRKVLRMIDEQTKGKTVFIITHDQDGLEKIMDRVIHMKDLQCSAT